MAASTRDRIVTAARSAFATRGVDGTAITDLEEAAGLAPGSGGFYRYFKTKDEVLLEVVRREIDRVLEARPTTPPPGGDVEGDLAAEFAQGLELLHSLRTLMAILTRERGRLPEVGAEVSARLLEDGLQQDADRLAATLGRDGDGDGEGPDVAHLRAVRSVITSALVGYTLAADYFGTAPGGVAPDRFAATLAALVAADARPR